MLRRLVRFVDRRLQTDSSRWSREARKHLGAWRRIASGRDRRPEPSADARMASGTELPEPSDDVRILFDLAYRSILGRNIEPEALAGRVAAFESGTSFAKLFYDIATSDEAMRRARLLTDAESAHLIEVAHKVSIGRAPDPEMLAKRVAAMQSGTPFSEIFLQIATSEEAARRAGSLQEGQSSYLVQLAYRTILGRDVDPEILASRVAVLDSGVPFADMFVEIATSEISTRRNAPRSEEELAHLIDLVYHTVLGRAVEPETAAIRLQSLVAAVPFADMFLEIASGEESIRRNGVFGEPIFYLARGVRLGAGLTDGEFLLTAGQLVYGRGINPREMVTWQGFLDEEPDRRLGFVADIINDHIKRVRAVSGARKAENDPERCPILGTDRWLTKRDWDERGAKLLAEGMDHRRPPIAAPAPVQAAFRHSGVYKVSMIASLYRGGKFIRSFLDNLTSQSIFDEAELIIVDADSPEGEFEVINEYQERFPNIVYKRMDYRIGIYDAWNVGVGLARGRYLTNTNLDDQRRWDSLALQAAMLDRHDDVDVVYQDFYYSFDPFLSFEEVAAYGFKGSLPIITPNNLLLFNSPHNAPMWRASLHRDVGYFDISYRSAGDWEFWLRCLSKGKSFRKINSPHVIYYQNPDGISTGPNTRGLQEGGRILAQYCPMLTSPALLQTKRDFWGSLGMNPHDDTMPADASYYDCAQQALLQLAVRHPAAGAASVQHAVESLAVDGVVS